MIDLAALRASTDLVALIERNVKLRRRGREHWGLCPFHQEKTPSFSVNPEKQLWHCRGCGAGGDAIAFVMRNEKVDFKVALARLGGSPVDAEMARQLAEQQTARNAKQLRTRKIEALWLRHLDCWPLWPEWARWLVEFSEEEIEAIEPCPEPAPPILPADLDAMVAGLMRQNVLDTAYQAWRKAVGL
jgi:hypothetical protein